jgi:hypothetical protein
MNLRARQVTLSDYSFVHHVTFETFGIYGDDSTIRAEWESLFRAKEERGMVLFGIVVEDIREPTKPVPVAYQQVRFVSQQFVDSYQTDMSGWLLVQAQRLLERGDLPGLTEDELLEANEQKQVHLLIDYYGWAPELSERDAAIARDYLYRSFQWLCRGYNLQSILIETIRLDSMGTKMAKNTGFQIVRAFPDGPVFHGVTREQALSPEGASFNSMIAALFAGGTPRLRLDVFERNLILCALWGFTNDVLVVKWHLSEHTIGTYWKDIYYQVKRDMPSVFTDKKMKQKGDRGSASKELLLNFLRNNPHELGPIFYLPPEFRYRPRRKRKPSII